MRRFVYLIVLLSALVAASCIAPPPASLTPSLPTTQPPAATVSPAATVPAAGGGAPVTPRPATATAPAVATPPPAPTLPPTATLPPAATAAPGSVAAFTSTRLGISFNYLTAAGEQPIGVLEQGDRVYVYAGNTQPTQGQWVQVFSKPAPQGLPDAINALVLKGYSLQDCIVTTIANPENGQTWPATYTFARIDVPRTATDDMGTLSAKAQKCPQPYAAVGGLAYFVADSRHPDRFAFFSIGQYYIPAGPQLPWQVTLRFLDNGSPTPLPTALGSDAPYLDDRSTPQALLASYFNAINHREYARAYYYWNLAAGLQAGLAPFAQFQAGYANTKTVQLALGAVTGDAGAGQLYYWAPAALVALTDDGAVQTFVGCYKLHLARPGIQGVPPFMPLAIESAAVRQVANDANTVSLLAAACDQGGQPMPANPPPAAGDISAARYLDDRTDGVQVLRSLFNAINSHEYVRAFSYWEASSPQRPPFAQFEQGYANTASVELFTGAVGPGVAAGNIYYQVPAVLIATNTDGSRQTFAGCYTLHMANPGMQTEPSFVPLGISSAAVRQVPDNTDLQTMLQGPCSQ